MKFTSIGLRRGRWKACWKNVVEPTCRSREVNLCMGVWLKAQCLRVEGRKADKSVVKGMLSAADIGVDDKRGVRGYEGSCQQRVG